MKNRHDRRLEGDLRASRPEPRADFAQALGTSVRSRKASERTGGRFGLAIALAGLVVVAVASFGGISYAATKKQGKPNHVWIVQNGKNAAAAQYDTLSTTTTTEAVAPIQKTLKPKPVTPATGTEGAAAVKGQAAAPKVSSSQLPFTGLALWVPLAIGLLLVAFGLGLRTRARRRDDVAH